MSTCRDGCEATSSTLVLPGHSHLVKEDNSILNSHSVQFTLQYTKVQDFDLIKQIIPQKLSPEQLKAIGDSIPEPQTSSIMTLQGQLKDINTNYPYVMPLYLKIILTSVSTILLVAGVTLGFKCYKRGCSVNKSVVFSKTRKTGTKNQGRPQSISGKYCSTWRQPYWPRSSVVSEEMEMQMQPMMGPAITRTLNAPRVSPPALEAPKPISEESITEEGIPVTPEMVAQALETNVGLDFKKFYNKKRARQNAPAYHRQ